MIEVKDICKNYTKSGLKREKIEVLKDIKFSIIEGECIGLVGESGSGKSTLSRLILGLEEPSSGTIMIEGKTVKKWIRDNKGKMSVVFQDYTSSINPNFTVKEAIIEPLTSIGRKENLDNRVDELLEQVGLDKELKERYPHELSGGQVQRVCIARAISTNPKFIVLDEAISALDVSIQSQVLNLLDVLRKDLKITYLFIAHDIQAAMNLCNKIMFLYKGNIVEQINSVELCNVEHEYSRKLINSVIPFS
ncbi:MAG: ABC transporter ATP-binding protein [Peptostreptococcaceae bacterium]